MFKFNKNVEQIILKLAEYSAEIQTPLYFVGGMVRDCLMGRAIKDIDLLVEGSAIDFAQGFKKKFNETEIKSLHPDFNTAKTAVSGTDIDFASTREEDYPSPGGLPAVKNVGCSIDLDLKRRDFTVNSIAARISAEGGELCYEIIDPFSGASDIRKKTLHVLHKKSYIDDPTRVLRGLDFCLRFGFRFSKEDEELIEESLKSPNREGLSLERVKLTLNKLFSSPERCKSAYEAVLDKKFYRIWQDETVSEKKWAEKLEKAAEIFNCPAAEIFTATLLNTPRCNPKILCQSGTTDETRTDCEAKNLCKESTFCKKETTRNSEITRKTGASGETTPCRPTPPCEQGTTQEISVACEEKLPKAPDFKDNFDIYNFYKPMPNLEIALRYAILNETEAELYFKKLKDKKTILTGKYLIENLGFKQGKSIGAALSAVMKEKLNSPDKIFTLQDEIEILKNR